MNPDGLLIICCSDHVVTRTVVGDLLLLTAFLSGVYIFRYGEPEHLSALMQTVRTSKEDTHQIRACCCLMALPPSPPSPRPLSTLLTPTTPPNSNDACS